MKNLTKHLLLLLISPGTILFFMLSVPQVFAGEWAKLGQTCTEYCSATGGRTCTNTQNISSLGQTVGSSCSSRSSPLLCDSKLASQSCCECQSDSPTPTPTPAPTSPPATCTEGNTRCRGSAVEACDPDHNQRLRWIISGHCSSGTACVQVSSDKAQCQATSSPTPTRGLLWIPITVCSTPASTTTVFQTSCPTSDIGRCGGGTPPFPNCTGLLYSAGTPLTNCTKELPNCWSCPLPPTPTPTTTPVSQCLPADCGGLAACAVGSSCQQVANVSTKSCACQPTTVSTATPTITPTPLPGSVQLALSVAQQGLTSTPLNINRQVTVILKGADGQTTTKTGTVTYSGGTFNGTINLGVLPNGSYKSKVKVGSFLKSFTADLAISGTAASAQTKVIAGLDDQDDIDAISFYNNGLRKCFGSNIGFIKPGCTTPQDVDLNGDGNADIIDYQIYLKGIRNLQQGLPVI